MKKTKKILIAPLDWGLGHATRCIPIIQELLSLGCEVVIAGNEKTNSLLMKEFPSLQFIYLNGYNISYSSKKMWMPFSILSQIPKLLKAIHNEHKFLAHMIDQYAIDAVISDNRYGLYHPNIPSVLITHQLNIQVPQSSILQTVLNKFNRSFIKKFHDCWVPDYAENGLSGDLAANKGLLNLTYIGNLSRFSHPIIHTEMKYELLVLVSGPEPQRSIFEKIATEETKNLKLRTLIVRGVPADSNISSINKHLDIVDHLPASLLEKQILSSKNIICRSGYSTLMDLVKLNKHAVLIPTPGQTEQEYLASYLSEKKWFRKVTQTSVKFNVVLQNNKDLIDIPLPHWDMNLYQKEINHWYQRIV